MKKTAVLFFVLAMIGNGCNSNAKEAKQYHDRVLKLTQTVIDNSLDFSDAVQSYDKERATKALEQYTSLVNETISKVEAVGNFKEDTTLRSFALEMLGFYKETLSNDFAPFLKQVKGNSFTVSETATADSLVTEMTMTENSYWERFNWAEKKFSKEKGIENAESK